MLKEFIEHIQKTTQPIIHQEDGVTYVVTADGEAVQLRPEIDSVASLPLTSLDALVKLVRSEAANVENPLYITVPDHLTVLCFGRSTPNIASHGITTTGRKLPTCRGGGR